MKSRITTALIALIAVGAAGVFALTLSHALFYAPDDTGLPALNASSTPIVAETASTPMRLQIPSLSIDAHVQSVGVNAKGNMAVPSNFTDVAWYKYGPVPGQLGSAVIDGHVDNALSLAGVFKHLGDMKVGDDVFVVAKDGTRHHFVVTDIAIYPYTDGPVERIFGAKDAAHLNLVTCAGTWLKGGQTYNERLVVYTTYKDSVPAG